MNKHGKAIEIATATAYVHGYIEAKIEGFAQSASIPSGELTARLGELLLGSASRQILGAADNLPTLRGNATQGHQERKRTLALASGSPTDSAPRKKDTSRMKAYWARMTPEKRSAEVRRRMRKAARNAAHKEAA